MKYFSEEQKNFKKTGLEAAATIERMHRLSAPETERRYSDSAEMKLVQAVHDHEGMHVIGLSEVLGITKGAVSQTLAKLEKKGLIEKARDPENASRLKILLTEKGKALYEAHENYHRELDSMIAAMMEEASPESREFLKMFLERVNCKLNEEWNVLEKYLNSYDIEKQEGETV